MNREEYSTLYMDKSFSWLAPIMKERSGKVADRSRNMNRNLFSDQQDA